MGEDLGFLWTGGGWLAPTMLPLPARRGMDTARRNLKTGWAVPGLALTVAQCAGGL